MATITRTEAIEQSKLQWTGNKIPLSNNIISEKEYIDIMQFYLGDVII